MLTWKTIEDLPDRTPVPLDLALEALQPENPRALLLRLYGGGHLLEELPPDAIMKWSREALAEMGAATHQFDKRLAPVETMTPYLSDDPSTWARLHILREELLALRPAPKLETSPAGQARKIVLPVPGTKETAARAPEKITPAGSAAAAFAEMEKRTMAEIAEMERSVSGSAAKALAEAVAWEKNIIRPILNPPAYCAPSIIPAQKNIIRPTFPPLNVLLSPHTPTPPPAALPDHQEAGPELIGSTFVYTWKGIAAELDASVDTAKRYAKRGLVVLTTPSGRVATTKEEIARWSKTPEGRRLIKK